MSFTSFSFYAILLVLLVSLGCIKSNGLRQWTLLAFSLYFYASIEPVFVFCLTLLVAMNYGMALGFELVSQNRRYVLWLSLAVNFGLLALLKYGNFVSENIEALTGYRWLKAGETLFWLPVGISFFTFQAQSYIFDVYYRVIPAERSFRRFALYVCFFPQLVAGPIVKARHFLPQLSQHRVLQAHDILPALQTITTGLVFKVVVADNLAHYTLVLQEPLYTVRHSLNLVVLSWAFMVQVFGDFAGYTMIAIGVSRLLGYQLPENFNRPFIATGFNDFWKRWHISLTSWFKDYVFLRLAMSSPWKGKVYRSLALTFLLSGLWHGASWTYVLWGGLHGLGCIVDSHFNRGRRREPRATWLRCCMGLMTFQLVCFFGIFFFNRDMGPAWGYYTALLSTSWGQPLIWPRIADMLFFMAPVALYHTWGLWQHRKTLEQRLTFQVASVALNLVLLCCLWGEEQAFIYFAF